MRRPRRILAIAAAVVVLALVAGGVWWRSTADERAWRELASELQAQCIARAVTGPAADTDAAIEKCQDDYETMLKVRVP